MGKKVMPTKQGTGIAAICVRHGLSDDAAMELVGHIDGHSKTKPAKMLFKCSVCGAKTAVEVLNLPKDD